MFCYTGDLVRVQGMRHIAFVDRLGDTFRWKGENVATSQVEAALDAFAGLREAVVYGVPVPHADGRAGMAALVADGDPCDLDFAALLDHLERELPAYAVPVFLRLCAQADVTATMKYRKTDLRARGYAPSTREPVYVRRPRGPRYERLTARLRERIDAGAVAL